MGLWVPSGPGFQYRVSNVSGSRPSSSFGTTVTSNSVADSSGSVAQVIAGSSIAEDCYGLHILVNSVALSATDKSGTLEIFKDEAGGTSWGSVWLGDLICGHAGAYAGTTNILGVCEYYFPLFIKAGTSLGAAFACAVGSSTARVILTVLGRPRFPELVWCGTKFQSFGASSGNGTSLTSGTTSEGSWTQLGSAPSTDLCWWQYGFQVANTVITAQIYHIDLARGDASNKHVIFQDEPVYTNTAEKVAKILRPGPQYWGRAAANDNIYMRAQCSGTPDSGLQVAAYGVG